MKIILGSKAVSKIGQTLRGLLAFVTKEPLPRGVETTLSGLKQTDGAETKAALHDKGDSDRS